MLVRGGENTRRTAAGRIVDSYGRLASDLRPAASRPLNVSVFLLTFAHWNIIYQWKHTATPFHFVATQNDIYSRNSYDTGRKN